MDTPPLWSPVDPLGEALHLLRMSGTFYSRTELGAPWGLALPAMPQCLMFHVVVAGGCWLLADDADPVALQPGDFILVPHGQGHGLASAPETPLTPLFDLPREEMGERYELLRNDAPGAQTRLVCGAVRFEHPSAARLIAMLPRTIHIAASDAPTWMPDTLRIMATETRTLRPGGEAIVTRLADILVIQAIRAWLERAPEAHSGWLGALRDRQIGGTLARIHRQPAHPWTLASLAAAATMSRSAFAARFTALVGIPAMQYLAQWRMQLAHARLCEQDVPLATLAEESGYQSETAFSRAFKREFGVSPGAVRKQRPAMVAGAAHPSAAMGAPHAVLLARRHPATA